MTKEEIREKYFKLKGQFLEIVDLLEESEWDSIGLAACVGESALTIYFDDFKMSFDEEMQEINLSLYLYSQEMANFNIVNNYNFKFYFYDLSIDFEEEKKAC